MVRHRSAAADGTELDAGPRPGALLLALFRKTRPSCTPCPPCQPCPQPPTPTTARCRVLASVSGGPECSQWKGQVLWTRDSFLGRWGSGQCMRVASTSSIISESRHCLPGPYADTDGQGAGSTTPLAWPSRVGGTQRCMLGGGEARLPPPMPAGGDAGQALGLEPNRKDIVYPKVRDPRSSLLRGRGHRNPPTAGRPSSTGPPSVDGTQAGWRAASLPRKGSGEFTSRGRNFSVGIRLLSSHRPFENPTHPLGGEDRAQLDRAETTPWLVPPIGATNAGDSEEMCTPCRSRQDIWAAPPRRIRCVSCCATR